jgi:hypothetical protein
MKPLLGLEGEKLLEAARSEIGRLKGTHDRLWQLFDLYDQLYLLKPKQELKLGQIEGPRGVEVITNDACNSVNVMANMLAAAVVSTTVSSEKENQKVSDEAELFYQNALYQTQRRLSKPQLALARMDQCRYGRACLNPYWEGSSEYVGPMVARIHPRKVLWEHGGPRDDYAAIVVQAERSVTGLEAKYGVTLAECAGYDQDAKAKEKRTVYDIWKWETRKVTRAPRKSKRPKGKAKEIEAGHEAEEEVVVNTILTDRTVLKAPEVMEAYRFLPMITFGAYPIGEDALEYEFVPVTFFIHTAILLERRLRTSQFKRLDQMIRLPLFFRSPNAEMQKRISLEEGPYIVWPLLPGEEVGFPEWRGSPVDVENLASFLDAQRQKGGFTDLALGEMLTISGIAATKFWQGNVLKMRAPADEYARAIERALEMFKDFALAYSPTKALVLERPPTGKEGGGTFAIMGKELKGTKIYVRVDPDIPADIKYRDRQFGLQLLRMGNRSPFPLAYILEEYFHIDQPQLLLDKKRQEIEQYGDILGWLQEEEQKKQLPAEVGPRGTEQLLPQAGTPGYEEYE